MLGDGLVELGDLVALGQVGIEVVLAGEDGALADFTTQGQGGQGSELDRLFVEHRESARQSQADGADIGVGSGAELVGATAECLGGGEQLDVDLESYDGLVLGQNLG